MRIDDLRLEFLDPRPLRDEELELIEPSAQWIDELLLATHHPITQAQWPAASSVSRQDLLNFLHNCPRGRQSPDGNYVPAYHFWMRLRDEYQPAIRLAGEIGLRIGQSPHIQLYAGHIGYHVYPPARGHHLAERACRLLLPLARAHGIQELWITCNPDNFPSRRTCERLGAQYVETVKLPADNPLYAQGEREKRRYRLALG